MAWHGCDGRHMACGQSPSLAKNEDAVEPCAHCREVEPCAHLNLSGADVHR